MMLEKSRFIGVKFSNRIKKIKNFNLKTWNEIVGLMLILRANYLLTFKSGLGVTVKF